MDITGTGDGRVASQPGGIDCTQAGGASESAFEEGTVVTLIALPDAGATFTDWSGSGAGADVRTVTMSQAASVTATFDDPNTTVAEASVEGAAEGDVTVLAPARYTDRSSAPVLAQFSPLRRTSSPAR